MEARLPFSSLLCCGRRRRNWEHVAGFRFRLWKMHFGLGNSDVGDKKSGGIVIV